MFQFIKYIQPTSYFELCNKAGVSVFPIVDLLPKDVQNQLSKDTSYKSHLAQQYDLSWQALQKGYIGNAKTYSDFEKLPLQDEYRFIKKYFSPLWAIYVLLLRVVTLKNPIKEINSLYNVRNVKRVDVYSNPITYKEYEHFNSELITDNPKVSIVIPTLNRYKYLKDVLHDLEQQEYKNFEVIVVDQSVPFQKDFYEGYDLELNVINQKEKALWLARNTAIKQSESDYILLFDDDSRVESDWITNHLKCIDFFKCKISSGVSISVVGAKVPTNYSYFRVSDQIDTGNALVKKGIFNTVGLFDRQFEKQRMGDGEFGLRSYLEGFLNVSNPYAKRLHLKVATGGLREMGSWDAFRPKKWFSPRPIPSVLYLFRNYFGNHRSKLALLKTVPSSIMPYRFKRNKRLMIIGAIISMFIFPIVLIQVVRSWKKASKKIKQGQLIEQLN